MSFMEYNFHFIHFTHQVSKVEVEIGRLLLLNHFLLHNHFIFIRTNFSFHLFQIFIYYFESSFVILFFLLNDNQLHKTSNIFKVFISDFVKTILGSEPEILAPKLLLIKVRKCCDPLPSPSVLSYTSTPHILSWLPAASWKTILEDMEKYLSFDSVHGNWWTTRHAELWKNVDMLCWTGPC